MRVAAYIALLGLDLLFTPASGAPNFPPGAESTERQGLAKLDGYWRNWVKEQARTMVTAGRISEDRARSLAQGARLTSGADVSTMSFLLLMQAARDADADLQSIMDRSRAEFSDREELSSLAHNRAPVVSQLSTETQTVLSMKGRTKPIMTWKSNDTGSADSGTPTADVDDSVHVDLQTAMDRESAAEAALNRATARLAGALPSSSP